MSSLAAPHLHPTPPTQPRSERGSVGLMEAVVVLALAAIVAAGALPLLQRLVRQWRIESASTDLTSVLRMAREQSTGRQAPLRLETDAKAEARCLLLHTGSAGDCRGCTGEPVCRIGATVIARTRALPPELQLSTSSTSLLWHPTAGTVTPTGTFRLTLPDGTELQHVVNLVGRVRVCSTRSQLGAHPPC